MAAIITELSVRIFPLSPIELRKRHRSELKHAYTNATNNVCADAMQRTSMYVTGFCARICVNITA